MIFVRVTISLVLILVLWNPAGTGYFPFIWENPTPLGLNENNTIKLLKIGLLLIWTVVAWLIVVIPVLSHWTNWRVWIAQFFMAALVACLAAIVFQQWLDWSDFEQRWWVLQISLGVFLGLAGSVASILEKLGIKFVVNP